MPKLSRKSQQRIVIGVMCALAIAFGFWLFLGVEWREEELDLGYSEEARRNPFLAAQQFLAERNIEVEVVKSFSLFDTMAYKNTAVGAKDTVILVGAFGVLEGERLNNLWQWLHAGGNLVISTQNPFIDASAQRGDALFSRLPLSVEIPLDEAQRPRFDVTPSLNQEPSTQQEPSARAADSPAKDTVSECKLWQKGTLIQNLDAGVDFQIAEMGAYPVHYTGSLQPLWKGALSPAGMLRFVQGDGVVTASADNNLWRNDAIGCFDHAYALALLAQNSEKVWFVINVDAPSLWRVLWRAAPLAVTLFALALVLWLWATAKRFLPSVTVPETSRRSFVEHLRASAMFLWRRKRGSQLIDHLRRDILQLMARRYPDFSIKDRQQKIEFIGQSTGLADAEVEAALFHSAPITPAAFTQNVKRLQQIRNML